MRNCFKQRPVVMEQLMGHLPPSRITFTRPFNHTGVDYAGPFEIAIKSGIEVLNSAKDLYLYSYVCLLKPYIWKL